MIKKRFRSIVQILLRQEDFITIQDLAEQLAVSYKTISNDLKGIEKWLEEQQLTLIKKPGIGVQLMGSNEAKLRVCSVDKVANTSEYRDYSPRARMIYIGIRLLTEECCRIFQLADELFVSRATIHKDLAVLSDYFASFKLALTRKSNAGASVTGSEKNFRNCLIELMKEDSGYATFYQIVQGTNYVCEGSFPFAALDFNDDEISEFLLVLKQTQSEYLEALTFDAYVQAIHYILVSFIRVRDQHPIHLSDEFMNELKLQPYYEDVRQICQLLGLHYQLKYNEREIRYLQVFFLSLRTTHAVSKQDLADAGWLTNKLMQEWEKLLPYPFSKDEDLRHFLFNHFCSAITRYRHGIPSENGLLEDIMQLHPHTFAIIQKTKFIIEERFHCRLDEEELGLLALHLAVALDKAKDPLNTLVVCHEGVAATNLLTRKLETQFFNVLAIKNVLLTPAIQKADLKQIDLILTTRELPVSGSVPMLEIDPLLSKQDLILLRKSILPYYEAKNDHMEKMKKF